MTPYSTVSPTLDLGSVRCSIYTSLWDPRDGYRRRSRQSRALVEVRTSPLGELKATERKFNDVQADMTRFDFTVLRDS